MNELDSVILSTLSWIDAGYSFGTERDNLQMHIRTYNRSMGIERTELDDEEPMVFNKKWTV